MKIFLLPRLQIRIFDAWKFHAGANDGVAAVEFALVAPIFFAIVAGIIVYGVYFSTWIAVTQIASESARAAVAGLTTAEQQTLAIGRFNAGLASYAPLMSQSHAALTFPAASSGTFAVTVSYDFSSYNFTLISLLPIPATRPSITVTVSTGSP